jgi:hypothetical protein
LPYETSAGLTFNSVIATYRFIADFTNMLLLVCAEAFATDVANPSVIRANRLTAFRTFNYA